MPATPPRARRLAAVALLLALACGAAELFAGPGHRLGLWNYGPGIQIVRWAATAALAAAALALMACVWQAFTRPRRIGLLGPLALVASAVVAGPPLLLAYRATHLPRIHDITTDTANPPRFVAALPLRQGASNPAEYDAKVAALQRAGYPDLAPAILAVPPAQAVQQAERALRALGLEVVAVVADEGRLEAVATSLLFGFKDDVVVRITAEGGGSRVDVRSLSRVGLSDIGANAARIRSFIAELRREPSAH